MNGNGLERLGLKFNPFPPATTGVAIIRDLWIPDSWARELQSRYTQLSAAAGDKAIPIIGEYGSGKTYLLQWLAQSLFQPANVRVFFFENPGIAFYDLANRLLRQVGRYELAKALWELLYPRIFASATLMLVPLNFSEWLASVKTGPARTETLRRLASLVRDAGLTEDEEIAYRLARVVVETGDRPYFEYRDFVAGRTGALVPEREEAAYFQTLIRLLRATHAATAVAFLIDEFEDVALQRRLNRKQSLDYLSTLRRLVDTTREESFWVVVSMTPEAFERTTTMDPSLIQRFVQPYIIPPLKQEEARELVRRRLTAASTDGRTDLWPFADDALQSLRPTTLSRPRPLIKVCGHAISIAVERELPPPLSQEVMREAEQAILPGQ